MSATKESVLTAQGSVLLPEFLPTLIKPEKISDSHTTVNDYPAQTFVCQRLEARSNDPYSETIMATERQMLRQVLAHTEGNQLKAAAILGI